MILRVIHTAAKDSAAKTKIASLTSLYRSASVTCSGLGKFRLAQEMGHSIPFLFGSRSSRTHSVLQQTERASLSVIFFSSEIQYARNSALGGDPGEHDLPLPVAELGGSHARCLHHLLC